MAENKSNQKAIKIAVSAIVLILIVFVVGYWIGLFSSPKPKQNGNTSQLTITSFEKEVMGELSSYLNLVIDNYWVEGNNVRSTGTVNWLGGEYAVSGAKVCMYITESQTNSVNVKVVVHLGNLLLPKPGTVDFDSVQIPTLGIGVFSFDFSLTCTYK